MLDKNVRFRWCIESYYIYGAPKIDTVRYVGKCTGYLRKIHKKPVLRTLWGVDQVTRGQRRKIVPRLPSFSCVYYLFRKINTNKRTRLALPLWVLEEKETTFHLFLLPPSKGGRRKEGQETGGGRK